MLHEDACARLQSASSSLPSAVSAGVSCSGPEVRPRIPMHSQALRTPQQGQPTRRARLGTEASADAQPNSEGAKVEESRQLSRYGSRYDHQTFRVQPPGSPVIESQLSSQAQTCPTLGNVELQHIVAMQD